MVLKDQQRIRQGPLHLVVDAERDERFPLGLRARARDKMGGKESLVFEVDGAFLYDEESGGVVFDVLDACGHDGQAVDIGSECAGDGCCGAGRDVVVLEDPCDYRRGTRSRGYLAALDAFEIGR